MLEFWLSKFMASNTSPPSPAVPETPPAEEPVSSPTLQQLPGTQYARYAIPLDYPPSRDFRPRWGFTRPPIMSLYEWFAQYADDYRAFIAYMRLYGAELKGIPRDFDATQLPMPAWRGTAINHVDVLALYTFIRKYSPATYLEIGSGITTCVANLARQQGDLSTKIISIDPYPRTEIDGICDRIIREGLETCEISIFEKLQPGDIVFLDGSHRAFMNSDVTVFFIDVLPVLRPGVIVHIHDIVLPWDYDQAYANWYWNEQYMLAVYMMASKARIRPLLPTAFVTKDAQFQKDLAQPFIDTPFDLEWRFGGSMWFTHV